MFYLYCIDRNGGDFKIITMIDFTEKQPKSMREVLDEMKSNYAKEKDKNRELAALKVARNPPAQKKSSYEKIPNITPPLNTKKVYAERCAQVVINMTKNLDSIEVEVETEPCKWCESDILKGREFCSKICEIHYKNRIIG